MNRQLGVRATLIAAISSVALLDAPAGDMQSAVQRPDSSEISVVEDGQSRYTIAIAAKAPLPVEFAAEQLQRYLAEISGARLPVSKGTCPELAICVGKGSTPAEVADKLRWNLTDRGEDCYLMCNLGKRLVLEGNSPRATLYAVYHFLE